MSAKLCVSSDFASPSEEMLPDLGRLKLAAEMEFLGDPTNFLGLPGIIESQNKKTPKNCVLLWNPHGTLDICSLSLKSHGCSSTQTHLFTTDGFESSSDLGSFVLRSGFRKGLELTFCFLVNRKVSLIDTLHQDVKTTALNKWPMVMSHDAATGYLSGKGIVDAWTVTQSGRAVQITQT